MKPGGLQLQRRQSSTGEKTRCLTRERLYEIIEKAEQNDKTSRLYDRMILLMVFLSAIPLIFKLWTWPIVLADRLVTGMFVLDYLLRWITADYRPQRKPRPNWQVFVLYPFTPMAIVDLLSILPVLTTISILPAMSLPVFFQVLRIMRVFRCVRLLKTMRYSKSCFYLYRAMCRERKLLVMVLMVAMMYIFVCAAIMFSVEPDTFGTFFDAVYWAASTLTTVGYGDIYPMTEIGRGISILSSVFGIAVVAMPSGIITAGFMEEVNRVRNRRERRLEEEVSNLLEEIRALRREQRERGLEEKIELIAGQVQQIQQNRDTDAVLLQDLSEDLKNALYYGTIGERED